MRWDLWELIGVFGEFLFFARMFVQWRATEKESKPVLPVSYWYLSLAGAIILIFYAIHLGSFPVLIPQIVGVVFYLRSLQLEVAYQKNIKLAKEFSKDFEGKHIDYPFLSIIVPVHNEEKIIEHTTKNLLSLDYPSDKLEIILALNGCGDKSKKIVEKLPVKIVESNKKGMSFGKNLGATIAQGDIWLFVDADCTLPKNALKSIVYQVYKCNKFIATVKGKPDKGGLVVKICFILANYFTKRKKAHAPGGVMVMSKEVFVDVNGFDEFIPQATSTNFIWQAIKNKAEYIFIDGVVSTTSIRRFEKTGIIKQMLLWRKNHKQLKSNKEKLKTRVYEDIR